MLILKLWRPALAGAAATCAGNGIARFAYVPMFPAMVVAGWVDGGQAGMLGAAALAGYLVGTLAGPVAGRRFGVPATLDLGMALVIAALAACAWNGGFLWFLFWRGMAGVAGGLLMALAGPASQASTAAARRGTAGGVVLAGVGVGIALGAVLVPLLVPWGLPAAWLGVAGLVLLLWIAARPHWPDMPMRGAARQTAPPAPWLLLTYGLQAAGMVAPMVYLSDLAARGLGLGVSAGALVWLLFGTIGICGAIAGGWVADRIGGRRALVVWSGLLAAALLLAMTPHPWLILPAAAASGFASVGVTTVVLAVCRELAPQNSAALWVRCTAIFGVVQASVAFALAALFAWTGESHLAIFAAGLLFALLSVASAMALLRFSR